MIQVINRALDILEFIAQDRSKPYKLNEISEHLNLNKGTCSNIIKTLVNRNYLVQEGRMKGYKIGSMSYMLTGNYSHKWELLEAATKPIEELSNELKEGCILSILKEDTRQVLFEVKTNHELQVVNKKEKKAYQTSTGRVILAFMKIEEQKSFIDKYGIPSPDVWPGVVDEDDLMIELNKIQKKGLSKQVSRSNIVGLAVPIFKEKEVIASLGVYLPEARFTLDNQDKILNELRKAMNIINKIMNGSKKS